MAEIAAHPVAFKFARSGDKDLAVHLGDQFQPGDPVVETAVAKLTPERGAHIGPYGADAWLVAAANRSAGARRIFAAKTAEIATPC